MFDEKYLATTLAQVTKALSEIVRRELIAGAITVVGGIYIWGEKSLHNTLHTFIVDGISALTIKKGITKLFFNVFEEIQFISLTYLTLHLLVLIPEIVIIIVYFCRPDIVTTFSRNIFNSSIQRYIGYDSPDIHSYALNHIMIQLQCCGINNGSDFVHVKMTKPNIMYKGEPYGE
uniref:Uncharacterized protein n=1 Tax=Schistosoma haematobium TaxID=6185 RepID=A0A094ZMY2_SCHHA